MQYSNGTVTTTLYPSGSGFSTNTFSTTSFSKGLTLTVYLAVLNPGTLNPGTLTYYTYGYGLGPQAAAVSLVIASSNMVVGTITGSPATFVPGTYYNQTLAFHPVGAGTTNLTLTDSGKQRVVLQPALVVPDGEPSPPTTGW